MIIQNIGHLFYDACQQKEKITFLGPKNIRLFPASRMTLS